MTAKLGLMKEVLSQLRKLPNKISKGLDRFMVDFQKDPTDPRLYVHKLDHTMVDNKVWGAKLPDGYRAILVKPEIGNNWVLAYVDTHDNAYNWAKNKRFEMHTQTGVFQIYDVVEAQERIAEATFQHLPSVAEYPLNNLSDEELFLAGLPKALIPAIRAVKSDEGFEALAEYIPPECREVLYCIAAGMTLDEALEETLGGKPGETNPLPTSEGDFTNLSESPTSGLIILDQGEEVLSRALSRSLEEWRVFLHPSQRSIVYNNARGPMKITGTAGTGKTVALLHRAVHLAQELSKSGSNDEGVLLLTFTMNLAYNLKEQLRALDQDAASRITVTHLYGFARTLCQRTDWRGEVKFPDELSEFWDDETITKTINEEKCPLTPPELMQEFERIIDPLGIATEEEYLTAVRSGVPRLKREQRKQVWQVMVRFFDKLRSRGDMLTPNGTVRHAYLALEHLREHGEDKRKQILSMRYPYVLVDEVQDLSLVALRFLTALPVSLSSPNCLTLAGDGHQRLYRHKVSLRRVGIEVQGRSRRLKINYRTTDEIRKWGQSVLRNQPIDDLDDNKADIRGDRSVMHGPQPEIVKVTDKSKATRIIGDWVERLHTEHSIEYYAICIVSNDEGVISHLADRKIPFNRIRAKEPDYGSKEPGVRIGTVERIKGLEFRAVCLTGVKQIPEDAPDALHERCKWYVAATRAREYLLVLEE